MCTQISVLCWAQQYFFLYPGESRVYTEKIPSYISLMKIYTLPLKEGLRYVK